MAIVEIKAKFSARLQELREILCWIREQLSDLKFSQDVLWKIELSSEEALVNIIRHAYKNQNGEIEVIIKLVPHQYAKICFKDNGPAFNPLEQDHSLDRCAPLEERNEGGLGIILIRKYMDEVHYERKDSWNHLTLIKKVS